jgi:hypothetical protein
LRIFLQGGSDDFFDRTVMAQMNHFGAIRHQDAAHDVDRGIMAVEQRSSRDKRTLLAGLYSVRFWATDRSVMSSSTRYATECALGGGFLLMNYAAKLYDVNNNVNE